MKFFKTRDIANPGKRLTKDTIDRDTLWGKHMDNLLTCTNRQIELNIAYNKYHCTKASSSNSSNQHTQMWIANRLYCSILLSQLESCTLNCTHSNATNQLRTMASRKNVTKDCTATSKRSTSIAKTFSKTKSIKKTMCIWMTCTTDPIIISMSSMMRTLRSITSKSVL